MRIQLLKLTETGTQTRRNIRGQIRIAWVAAVLLAASLTCGGVWFLRTKERGSVQANGQQADRQAKTLSASTMSVLGGLKSPVEIRFYSLLDPASVSPSLQAFAHRVDQLLTEYEHAGNGRITVTRINTFSDANTDAALADGIRPFNLDKGDACYLGIAIHGKQKQPAIQLSEQWEAAIEFDLSRAIASAESARPPVTSPAVHSGTDVAAANELLRSNPKLASLSLEEGTRVLRESALAEFRSAVNEMQNQIKAAEQRLTAQAAGSDSARLAAKKEIQQIQAEQRAKIQEIGARLEKQIAALERAKELAR